MNRYSKVEELKEFWLKRLEVELESGKKYNGYFRSFTRACDNVPELESIDLEFDSDSFGIEIYLKDIKSIKILE